MGEGYAESGRARRRHFWERASVSRGEAGRVERPVWPRGGVDQVTGGMRRFRLVQLSKGPGERELRSAGEREPWKPGSEQVG